MVMTKKSVMVMEMVALEELADVELVRLTQETGNKAAQRELCKRYRPLLGGTVTNLQRTWHIAVEEEWHDLEGYLWLVLLESIREYDVEGPVPFAGFLNSKIKNGGLNYLRRFTRQMGRECISVLDSDGSGDESDGGIPLGGVYAYTPECYAMDQEVQAILHKEFMKLAVHHRKILMELVLKGRKGSELARELGVSRQTINRRKQAALAVLQAELLADGIVSKEDLMESDVCKLDGTLFN